MSTGTPDFSKDLFISLPEAKREIPEPLAAGHSAPGFKLRGTKGWKWAPEQTLAEIPFLARCKMNFFMNCYASLWGAPWWKPLPDELKRQYEAIVLSCEEHGITFCFCMNPAIGYARSLDYASDRDFRDLWQHYAWMQGLGVRWFSLCYDDIPKGIDALAQAQLVNRLFAQLREKDPQAELIFCPTHYTGVGKEPGTERDDPYLETLAREMHQDVYVFWTGGSNHCCGQHIRRADAESYRKVVGHRLIVWDNYPVNDGFPTLHLGPLTGRDPDLGKAAEGYISNPLYPQSDINRIPLMTCADYAYNPWAYDPDRAIGQAILHLSETKEQQLALRDLVELFPGFLIFPSHRNGVLGCWVEGNPVLTRFREILALPHARGVADSYLAHCADVLKRMRGAFAGQYETSAAVLEKSLVEMEKIYLEHNGEATKGVCEKS